MARKQEANRGTDGRKHKIEGGAPQLDSDVGSLVSRGPEVGLVLGTEDSTPLEFWAAVQKGEFLQLDDVISVDRDLPGAGVVRLYGVVTEVRARHEGAHFDSDVFLINDGVLPAEVCEAAQVVVTRCEPEIFVPPTPGSMVRKAIGQERDAALYFDKMKRPFAIGLSRDGLPISVDLEFLDGSKGAHVNISGISGVAAKTTYACFLLYSLFESDVLGKYKSNSKAVIFNVKSEDLLFLDQPNTQLPPEAREKYDKLQLPAGPFSSVAFWAPPVQNDVNAVPNVGSRTDGVKSFFWTLYDFCKEDLLQFLFADIDDERQQYTSVVQTVMGKLRRGEKVGEGGVRIEGSDPIKTFEALVEFIDAQIDSWTHNVSAGTIGAFLRRLQAAERHVSYLIRADISSPEAHRIDIEQKRVTVIDIHNLTDRAQRFVVGVMLRKTMEQKERKGQKDPLWFVVLDELNKYAPREGSSPIKEVLIDIAERGRSLGVVLIGAQQTASEVERRVTGMAALRVVGRLDSAESQRAEYGFLKGAFQTRATILKPGTVIALQPMVPVPLVLEFPFPSWATRKDEAPPPSSDGKDDKRFKGFAERA